MAIYLLDTTRSRTCGIAIKVFMRLGATVVTDNIRAFARVPGLLWVDWTK